MILILTGPPASGKSTLGPLIASRLERCAVIEVDWLRRMIVQPHVAPWKGAEGQRQLRLGAMNACAVARNCVSAALQVVVLDVLTDETATIYRDLLHDLAPQIILLQPTLDEALRRNRKRGQYLTDQEVLLLYHWQEELSLFDQRIDNSSLAAQDLAEMLVKLFT